MINYFLMKEIKEYVTIYNIMVPEFKIQLKENR